MTDGSMQCVTPVATIRSLIRRRLRTILTLPLAIVLMGGLAACAAGGPGSGSCPAPASPVGPTAATSPTYVIGAGDQLGISVYRAPELSVPSLPVRPDGRISMPLIPDIMAAGKTPTELGKELAARLKQYVQDPIVTVMVTGFVGPLDRQVKVIGEATEPAAIPYRDGMTVLDVMIATKGLTKYAAGNRSVIVRRVGDKQQVIPLRLSDLLKDGDYCDNVALLPGDTLIIPQSWF
ncbi:MAG TPA: XrtA/PEP-CTERM system exopolysaccharide export protein [Acetobacteraceae bacterium]|jgi:polysaccharide export outer membrane protein|nr:XrtA/PEP-CTERM system exopolysaccharide export protein [Acetobacteraceae bacterium]